MVAAGCGGGEPSPTIGRVALLRAGDGGLLGLAWGQDGRLAVGGRRSVQIWEAGSRRRLATLRGHRDQVWRVAGSPDGARLASTGEDSSVRVWGAGDGEPLAVLRGTWGFLSLAWSPDGRRLAAGDVNGRLQVWRMPGGTPETVRPVEESVVLALDWSPDGRALAAGTLAGTVVVTGRIRARFSTRHGDANGLAWSPDGRVLAVATQDGTVELCDRPGRGG